jgi:DNA repair exonuclease SbcCD ATPase subunit
MIGEALSLALSMLACRRAGLDRPTLVRDESGAALDPENARVYVAMLRRAAQLVGADKVLFVSHDPAVQALADSRIEVRP